jgi:hypothetical protein
MRRPPFLGGLQSLVCRDRAFGVRYSRTSTSQFAKFLGVETRKLRLFTRLSGCVNGLLLSPCLRLGACRQRGRGARVAGPRRHLESWAGRTDAWQPLVRHDADERVHELVHRDADVELYLVCCLGHDTGFHDHDDSAAAITVLEARSLKSGSPSPARSRGPSQRAPPSPSPEGGIHRVRHAGQAPAVTVHAYSPPLSRVGTYEVADDGALLRHPRPAETPLQVAA